MNGAGRRQQVVFSRHAYAYRATPGTVIVDRGQGDTDEVLFRNLTDQTVVVRDLTAGYVLAAEPSARARLRRSAQARLQRLLARVELDKAAGRSRVRPVSDSEVELWLAPGAQATLPLTGLPVGQYFYRATIEGTGLEAQGGSGPGIIITD